MDTIRHYGRNSICGWIINAIAITAKNSVAARMFGCGREALNPIIQGSMLMQIMRINWGAQGWLTTSYIARGIARLGQAANGLGLWAVERVILVGRHSLVNRFLAWFRRAEEYGVRYGSKVLLGKAMGIVFPLALMILSQGSALQYLGAAIAVYYIWRQPRCGLCLVLAGLAFLPTAISGRLILFTLAAATVKRWRLGQPVNLTTGVEMPLLLFFGLVGIAVSTSVSRAGSASVLPLYGLYVSAFYMAAILPRREDVAGLLKGLLLAGLVAGLIGLVQYKSGIETSLSWIDLEQAEDIKTRVFGPFDNPNIFAEYLTFVLPAALAFMITEARLEMKAVWAGVLVVSGVALVATFSRGGWLATGASLLLLGLMWEPRLVLLMTAAIFVFPALAPDQVMSRASSIGSLQDSSNVFRLSIWLASLKMIATYCLSGIGPGTAAFNRIYPAFMIAGTPAIHTHNLFLQLALELGLPGLLAFLWLLLAVFSRSVAVLPALSYQDQGMLTAVVAALTGFLLHGAVDNVWYSPKMTLLFWLILGLAVAMGKEADGSAGVACDN